MGNRINVAELLRDCPTGMELDCLMYDNVYFKCIREHAIYPIVCYTIDSKGEKEEITFNWYGKYALLDTAKCVIYPKGKTTWEGFQRPFKDGDVVAADNGKWIGITTGGKQKRLIPTYCVIKSNGVFEAYLDIKETWAFSRLANEEEKARLFQAIKDNGYHWNAESKILEKISQPKFKEGDIIADEHGNIAIYKGTMWYNKKLAGYYCGYRKSDNHFIPEPKRDGHFGLIEELHYATEEEKQKLFDIIRENEYRWNTETKTLEKIFPYNIGTKVWVKSDKEHKYIHTIVGISYNSFGNLEYEVKEEKTGIVVHYPKELLIPITKKPKFKVGDTIQSKEYVEEKRTIQLCVEDGYWTTVNSWIRIGDQDKWELVPNKFDINTLKPFDAVLVRNTNNDRWRGQFYMSYDKNEEYPFECTYNCWKQCIPYKGNEFLRGTSDECKDFYKTWE